MNKKTILYLYLSIILLLISQIACAVSAIESTTTPSPPDPTIHPTVTQFIYPTVTVERNIKIGIISNCSYLNLRLVHNDTSQILFSIPAGEKVEITGELKDNWYPVIYRDISGYVYSDYLVVQYP
jgi:uncharacterized protein YgiM (DUF1202 family)